MNVRGGRDGETRQEQRKQHWSRRRQHSVRKCVHVADVPFSLREKTTRSTRCEDSFVGPSPSPAERGQKAIRYLFDHLPERGLPTAPIWVPWTRNPSLNTSSIGIERTWYLIAVAWFWSTSTFTILGLAGIGLGQLSSAGAIIHGPHHGAQKSTSTGSLDCSTAASKSASVAWMTLSLTGLRGKGRRTAGCIGGIGWGMYPGGIARFTSRCRAGTTSPEPSRPWLPPIQRKHAFRPACALWRPRPDPCPTSP